MKSESCQFTIAFCGNAEQMATNDECIQDQPIVMRWKEVVSDGVRHWYVAAIRDDSTFWGYVHIRTTLVNENRSFAGQLAKSKCSQIRSLVHSVNSAQVESERAKNVEGLIGLGSRSDFKTIVAYDSERPDLPHAKLFRELVDMLQPTLIVAAKL